MGFHALNPLPPFSCPNPWDGMPVLPAGKNCGKAEAKPRSRSLFPMSTSVWYTRVDLAGAWYDGVDGYVLSEAGAEAP